MTANQIAYQNMLETRRSNLAKEAETNRSNVAREKETYRSNVAKEVETNRHNIDNERLGWANLDESTRSHKVQEQLGWANLSETARYHNQLDAVNWAGVINTSEKNIETNRHNTQMETQAENELTVKQQQLMLDKAELIVNGVIKGTGTFARAFKDLSYAIGPLLQ